VIGGMVGITGGGWHIRKKIEQARFLYHHTYGLPDRASSRCSEAPELWVDNTTRPVCRSTSPARLRDERPSCDLIHTLTARDKFRFHYSYLTNKLQTLVLHTDQTDSIYPIRRESTSFHLTPNRPSSQVTPRSDLLAPNAPHRIGVSETLPRHIYTHLKRPLSSYSQYVVDLQKDRPFFSSASKEN